MKIRTSFVANSSSSSFVIEKKYLTPIQISMIYDHYDLAEKIEQYKQDYGYGSDWQIEEDETRIMGYTSMDNFDLIQFIQDVVEVPNDYIEIDNESWR